MSTLTDVASAWASPSSETRFTSAVQIDHATSPSNPDDISFIGNIPLFPGGVPPEKIAGTVFSTGQQLDSGTMVAPDFQNQSEWLDFSLPRVNSLAEQFSESQRTVSGLQEQIKSMREEAKKTLQIEKKTIEDQVRTLVSLRDLRDKVSEHRFANIFSSFILLLFTLVVCFITYHNAINHSSIEIKALSARIDAMQLPTSGKIFPLDPSSNQQPTVEQRPAEPVPFNNHPANSLDEDNIEKYFIAKQAVNRASRVVREEIGAEHTSIQRVVEALSTFKTSAQSANTDSAVKSLQQRLHMLNWTVVLLLRLESHLTRIAMDYSVVLKPEHGLELTVITAQHFLRDALRGHNIDVTLSIVNGEGIVTFTYDPQATTARNTL